MPKIFNFNASFKQPVTATFQCEYCDHLFAVTGKLTTDVKTEKWVTERREEALAELRMRGEAELAKAKTEIEQSINLGGNLPKLLSNEGYTIRFEGKGFCPACGYHQRIAIQPKGGFQLLLFKLGCGGILLLLFSIGLLAVIQGTATSIAYIFLFGIPILAVGLLAFSLREPNRHFMKKHGLKKGELPQPRKPELNFGPITLG